MEDATKVKIVAIFIIFLISVIFGLLPLYVKYFREGSSLISYANVFAGAVFMSVGFLHILPETHEDFQNEYPNCKYPVVFLLAMVGYTVILCLEKVAFNSHQLIEADVELQKSMVIPEVEFEGEDEEDDHKDRLLRRSYHERSVEVQEVTAEQLKNFISHTKMVKSFQASFKRSFSSMSGSCHDRQSSTSFVGVFSKHDRKDLMINQMKSARTRVSSEQDQLEGAFGRQQSSGGDSAILEEPQVSKLAPFILFLALFLHASFAGMALGLQRGAANTANLMAALLFHKWAETLALGISFFRAETKLGIANLMIVLLSLGTPVGIVVGLCLEDSSPMFRIVVMSLAVGTFIYISTSEIVVEEFSITKDAWKKFAVFILGVTLIGTLIIPEENAEG